MSRRTTVIVAVGLAVSLLLAGGVSYFASGAPDGLNKVAIEQGFDRTQEDHDLAESPFAGYETRGVDQGWLAGGLAGVAGVGLTFLVAAALAVAVRRRTSRASTREQSADNQREPARDAGT